MLGCMNASEEAPETEVLRIHECWRYLRSSSIGRLAVTGSAGPEIFPVNYLPEDATLIFRTGPGIKLDALLGGDQVALEADGLNPYGTIAWSVVVKGHPEAVRGNDHDETAKGQGVSPWEPGVKDYLIRITPTEVSGRRFVISPPGRWWSPMEP
jgi:nitroimidazol reductase NimA-like FMN-containing flavoprotein (pyridoxamine 5'-phosphate oxidase superfamily)